MPPIVRQSFVDVQKGSNGLYPEHFALYNRYEKSCRAQYDNEKQYYNAPKGTLEREQRRKDCEIRQSTGTRERSEQRGIRSSALNEWGFSCKMLDLTRHIDSVRKA